MDDFKKGILYLGLHNQLVKKFGIGGIIKRKELYCKLGKHGQIPKKLKPLVLKEMEQKELIKMVNRDEIEVLKLDIDLERDANKLYEKAGIY